MAVNGAPLTPIFHQSMKSKIYGANELNQIIFINIGGISNATGFHGSPKKNQLKMFAGDIGPGNVFN